MFNYGLVILDFIDIHMHLYVCECVSVCHVLYIIIKHCFIHYYIYYYYYSSILGCTIIINCALKEKKNEKKNINNFKENI